MNSYLDVAAFRVRTVMPDEDVDTVEARYPGFILARLREETAWINGRLIKRYAVPFAAPVPEIVLGWLTKMVTPSVYIKRGWNGTSEQDQEILTAEKTAREEVKEAANSEEGLFELPLRQDRPDVSAVSAGGPLGYSEPNPYVWTDRQAEESRRG